MTNLFFLSAVKKLHISAITKESDSLSEQNFRFAIKTQ